MRLLYSFIYSFFFFLKNRFVFSYHTVQFLIHHLFHPVLLLPFFYLVNFYFFDYYLNSSFANTLYEFEIEDPTGLFIWSGFYDFFSKTTLGSYVLVDHYVEAFSWVLYKCFNNIFVFLLFIHFMYCVSIKTFFDLKDIIIDYVHSIQIQNLMISVILVSIVFVQLSILTILLDYQFFFVSASNGNLYDLAYKLNI